MAITEDSINKIKVLLYENKKDEAIAVIMAEANLPEDEAIQYIERLENSLEQNQEEKSKPKNNKIPTIILFVIGLIFWGLTAYFFIEKKEQLANSYLSSGVVVDFKIDEGAAPIIAYEIEGTPYQFSSSLYSNPPAYELNEAVEIYVNKDNPNDININSFANKWLLVTIFASFGLVLDLIAIVVYKLNPAKQNSGIDLFDHDESRLGDLDGF